MKRLLIAMKDSYQSQKLAIVLSNSYDSVTVDSTAKLKSYIKNLGVSFFTIIFEDSEDSECFSAEIEKLQKSDNITNPVIEITSKNTDTTSTNSRIILQKPFGVKELQQAITSLEKLSNSSNIAIA